MTRALVRAVAWQPVVLAALMCMGVVELTVRYGGPEAPVLWRFQLATLVVAAFTAFVVEDPAEATLAASPTALSVRRLHRVALVLPVVVTTWAVAAGRAGVLGAMWAPVGRALAVQGLMYAAVAMAVAAVVVRFGGATQAAVAGTTAALSLSFIAVVVPSPWSPAPASPLAPGAALRLVMLIGAALVASAWAAHDPASVRRVWRTGSTRTRWEKPGRADGAR